MAAAKLLWRIVLATNMATNPTKVSWVQPDHDIKDGGTPVITGYRIYAISAEDKAVGSIEVSREKVGYDPNSQTVTAHLSGLLIQLPRNVYTLRIIAFGEGGTRAFDGPTFLAMSAPAQPAEISFD
jgi:hypothetical protein